MIKHTIVVDGDEITALTHSDDGEYVGIAKCIIDKRENAIQVDELVTRFNSEMLVLKALGGYAEDNQLRVKGNPLKKITKNRERELLNLWNAMVNIEEYEAREVASAGDLGTIPNGLKNTFKISCDERTKRHTSVLERNHLSTETHMILEKSESVLKHVAESPVTVFIEDEYPLPPADPNTGRNINTSYQINEVIETYTSGKCMYLALALQERFGFDIDMHITKYQGNWVIEHAWCAVESDGVDIHGVTENYNWESVGIHKKSVSKKNIFNLMKNSSEYPGFTEVIGEKAVLDAHQLIDNYLLDYQPEISEVKVVSRDKSKHRGCDNPSP